MCPAVSGFSAVSYVTLFTAPVLRCSGDSPGGIQLVNDCASDHAPDVMLLLVRDRRTRLVLPTFPCPAPRPRNSCLRRASVVHGLLPRPGAGGRRTVDAWAPLDGRLVNAGLRIAF